MSSVKYVVVHRKDENNVGDMSSNPLQYFLKPDEYQTVDIMDINKTEYPAGVPIIVGGGGLIGNNLFADLMQSTVRSADKNQLTGIWQDRWKLCDPVNRPLHQEFLNEYKALISKYMDRIATTNTKRILWGAGHNGEYQKKAYMLDYPSWVAEFDHVGIRDWNQDLPWVPCASCMHPAFKRNYTVKNDVIWFEHKKQLTRDFGEGSIPRYVNSGSNVDQTIELLGSANIILTNSYHGAYWGTLLKKKVIIVGPWSSKFQHLKHMPYTLEKGEHWRDAIDKVQMYKDALSESIQANLQFWNKVK